MQSEVGVSPIELAQSSRLALAKQLLHDGAASMTEVAHASGFSSVRRFNAAFRARFGRSPSALVKRASTPSEVVSIALGHRAPIAWDALLDFLAPRATPGVEIVEGRTYARAVRIGDRRGWLEASLDEARRVVVVRVAASLARSLMAVAQRIRALFDLDARPDAIDAHLARDQIGRAHV